MRPIDMWYRTSACQGI